MPQITIEEFACKVVQENQNFFNTKEDFFMEWTRQLVLHFQNATVQLMENHPTDKETIFELHIGEKNGLEMKNYPFEFQKNLENLQNTLKHIGNDTHKKNSINFLVGLDESLSNAPKIENGNVTIRATFQPNTYGCRIDVIQEIEGKTLNHYTHEMYSASTAS